MKKRLYIIFTVFILILSLTSCIKCTSTMTKTVQVKIVDARHRPSYTTIHHNAATKTSRPRVHPAVYRITVMYNGLKYDFSGKDAYNKYFNKTGKYVNGVLQIKEYDNGKVKYSIIKLE